MNKFKTRGHVIHGRKYSLLVYSCTGVHFYEYEYMAHVLVIVLIVVLIVDISLL